MKNSAPERPTLTAGQKLELNYLKLTWDRYYAISYDGARWSAIPKGTRDVIHAGSKAEMNVALMADAAARNARPGHWIEVASGAPFHISSPE
jgi:hypothetical protein